MGGLGNQIFQIFTTISYAMKSRNRFHFLSIEKLGSGSATVRYTFWNTFFSKLKPFLVDVLPEPIYCIKERDFTYTEIPIYEIVNRNIMLYGYFQSHKYFQENYSTICKLIGIGKMKDALLQKLGLSHDFFKHTISMHFRLGDYKKIQEFHPLATYTFYEKSLDYIKTLYPNTIFTIMFFCEDEDIEEVMIKINKLQNIFPEYNFIRGEKDLADWEQMLLMSCCHHNIIANSTFSWWGAYFNDWQDKTVCYPSVWFGECANIDTKDLCPPEWMKIDV
jgi:hypothetical protein